MSKPAIVYFPVKGAAEVIRLTLAAAGVDFENENLPGTEVLKQDLDTYSFGQCPRYHDADCDLVQTPAILRYLARKHDLYGGSGSIVEQARIDQLLDGMQDLRPKIMPLVYRDAFQTDEARAEFWGTHAEPEAAKGQCRGAHMLYIDAFVAKHGKDGFAVGGQLSVADLVLFDLVELHQRVFGERFDKQYPAMAAHHAKIGVLPAVADYLASALRPEK
ncbi:flagellar associated [Micractinium conductrix]|uniref:glutathione transferase n=1 Tax=Micractinium conductrix TaxID=554055 RepID=A0A2P6V8K4_9CHLO|nr:flagellar associated [Micractinium conductrix]|eukprot:PSC70419.1 flagellar associated [Micractinium conductrix]